MSQSIQWQPTDNGLYRSFAFASFSAAFAFIVRVALLAEQHHHHPTWTNTYNRVEIWLLTHDAGNTITAKDHMLAATIDACCGTTF